MSVNEREREREAKERERRKEQVRMKAGLALTVLEKIEKATALVRLSKWGKGEGGIDRMREQGYMFSNSC